MVLVAPNTLGSYKFSGKNRENLALGVLGGYLEEQQVSYELIDARLDHLSQDEVLAELIKLRPLVVGLTLMGQEAAVWAGPLVKTLREELPETHITAGSYFPTLDPPKTFRMLPEVDSIALGEGEDTLTELTAKVEDKQDWREIRGVAHRVGDDIIRNPRRALIKDLDKLPIPVRYAKEEAISKVSLEGSRGCFARCSFCSIGPHTDPKRSLWRGKSPERIVAELTGLRNQYPAIGQYRFVDADFIGLESGRERVSNIAVRVIDAGFSPSNVKIFLETQSRNVLAVPPPVWEKFKRAGLYQVFIGIENASEKVKRAIGKPSDFETDLKALEYLRGFGFNVTYGFIMINPWSEMKDVFRNADALGKLGNAGLDKYFSELILTPGTRAFEMVNREQGVFVEQVDGIEFYSFPLPDALETIRRVGRYMVEDRQYRPILERIATVYTEIDNLLLNGNRQAADLLRRRLDDINQAIFLQIAGAAQENTGVSTEPEIKSLLELVIQPHLPGILQIEEKLAR